MACRLEEGCKLDHTRPYRDASTNPIQFELVNTYVSDPAHIAPSRSDANSNGHFPPANGHQPSGTPRGFNLNQYGMNGGMSFPGSNPGFFNGQGSGWGGRGGPDRRGAGGRYQEQRGPYDRRGDNRRYGPESGRLTPPGAKPGSGRPIGGRYDGAGSTGPREAVAGRSLKSYEDLDAVGGNAGGELNY